jgi:hypothetical protein
VSALLRSSNRSSRIWRIVVPSFLLVRTSGSRTWSRDGLRPYDALLSHSTALPSSISSISLGRPSRRRNFGPSLAPRRLRRGLSSKKGRLRSRLGLIGPLRLSASASRIRSRRPVGGHYALLTFAIQR